MDRYGNPLALDLYSTRVNMHSEGIINESEILPGPAFVRRVYIPQPVSLSFSILSSDLHFSRPRRRAISKYSSYIRLRRFYLLCNPSRESYQFDRTGFLRGGCERG